jgi:hypothetical protein
LNTYVYAAGNPVQFIDPLGLQQSNSNHNIINRVQQFLFTSNLNEGAVNLLNAYESPNGVNSPQQCTIAFQQIEKGQKQAELTEHGISTLAALPQSTNPEDLLVWIEEVVIQGQGDQTPQLPWWRRFLEWIAPPEPKPPGAVDGGGTRA